MQDEASPTRVMPWSSVIGAIESYAIFTMGIDGVIDSWNAGVAELLGYEEDEFLGRPSGMLFTPEDRAERAPERELEHARARGRAQDDRWHVRRDGSRIWVNGAMTALHDDEGALVGFVKVMRDQTEARMAQERLRESEERFGKSFRSNPNPMAILELPGGTVTEANRAFGRLFRRHEEALAGRALAEIGIRLEPARFQRIVEALERYGSAREDTTFRRHDQGVGQGTFAFERIELSGVPHAVMLLHDVTPWHQAQKEVEHERRFIEGILASLPGIFYMLEGERCIRWNDELERVTGYTSDDLAGMPATHLVAEGERALASLREALVVGRTTMEGHLRGKDGILTPYLFTAQRVDLADASYLVGVGVDITEQHRAHEALERRARQQAAIAELGSQTVGKVDLQGLLDRAATIVAETLGVEYAHVLEVDPEDEQFVLRSSTGTLDPARLVERFTPDDHVIGRLLCPPEEARGYDPVLSEIRPEDDETLLRHGIQSGLRAPIRGRGRTFGMIEVLSGRPQVFGEDERRFLQAVAYLLVGGIEHVRLHDELAHRAEHDALTGLPNRILFEDRLSGALERARRSGARVAVLFLDLDRFKNINDALGHHAGDELLKTVGQRLREAVRSWDVVARLGGDEFVLALPDVVDEAEVAHVTERILEAFDVPFAASGRELVVRTTVGISLYPDDGSDVGTLLRAADAALYEGKAQGRNTFRFFGVERNAAAADRLALENDLKEALRRNEFEVRYQPRVDVRNGRVTAVEALLRWQHPERGCLTPASFMSLVDGTGTLVPIGDWAMAEALARHAAWKREGGWPRSGGASPRISINVSAAHFVQPSFPAVLERLVHEAGLQPQDVELEITESILLRDAQLVFGHLEALSSLGVSITVDDFGTGYASLGHLRSLPIDGIKIDETFVHGLEKPDTHAEAFVEVITLLGTNLGKTIIAEGVETEEQLRRARELGCDEAQGHLVSPPLAASEVVAFVRARSA